VVLALTLVVVEEEICMGEVIMLEVHLLILPVGGQVRVGQVELSLVQL
jgi:hypothetical protein